MNIFKIIFAIAALVCALPASAGKHADSLSSCLEDNTTGKERKELARWVFVAMAAHPELQDLSTVTKRKSDEISEKIGKFVTQLVSERCPEQSRATLQYEGSEGFKNAFRSLGRVAMQEIMNNADVNSTISKFEKYMDQKKLESALLSK